MDHETQVPALSPAGELDESRAVLPSIYVNNATVSVTNWDFTFAFGELLGTDDQKKPLTRLLASVRMSPQHAKALSSILSENISKYEDNFGEIRWQPKKAAKSART